MKGMIGRGKGARRSFASKEKRGDPRCGPCPTPLGSPLEGRKRGRRTPVHTARRPTRMESTTRIGMAACQRGRARGKGGSSPVVAARAVLWEAQGGGGNRGVNVMHAHCDSALRAVPRGEGPLLCVVCLRPSSRVGVAVRAFAGVRKSPAGNCAVAVLCVCRVVICVCRG